MEENRLHIRPSRREDAIDIRRLWNDGQVMVHTGWPEGLSITQKEVEDWMETLATKDHVRHYVLHHEAFGFVGEAYYSADRDHDLGGVDIKLLPMAWGQGFGRKGLTFALDALFESGLVSRAYVEPALENTAAIKLYEKLGFQRKTRPSFLDDWPSYLELKKADWMAQKNSGRTP